MLLTILTIIISLSVSLILLRWLLKLKSDNPFPKGTVIRLLIGGMIAIFPAIVVPLLPTVVAIVFKLELNNIAWFVIVENIVLVGIGEEFFKFLFMKHNLKRKDVMTSSFDAVLGGAITGIGFQLLEDIIYLDGSLFTAIFRAVTPFHFTFGAIMGYFYARYVSTGKKKYSLFAVLVPGIVHGVFDYSISATNNDAVLILVGLPILAGTMVLTIVMITKIRKWNRLRRESTSTVER